METKNCAVGIVSLYCYCATARDAARDAAGDAAGATASDAAGAAAGATAWAAASDAASDAAGDAAGAAASDAAWDAAGAAAGATAWAAASDAARATISDAAAKAAWQAVIRCDSKIRSTIAAISFTPQEFNHNTVLSSLLDVDLSGVIKVAKGFYIYTLHTILEDYQASSLHTTELEKLIVKHDLSAIFTWVPIIIPQDCLPFAHLAGGIESWLARTIGEYAARAPTREEVMLRLLAL